MRDPLHHLTPKEREAVKLIRQAVLQQREIEFYSIHGSTKNNYYTRKLPR